MRNKTIDLMLAISIIYVVMGHCYQPKIFLLPAYTFQIAIFFFISGYFFQAQSSLKLKWIWIKKKFKHLILPYFSLNLIFAGLTYTLIFYGIQIGDLPTWHNFFITPFVNGQQYYLYLAAWFVPQLFLVHLVAQVFLLKHKNRNLVFLFIISFLISFNFIQSSDQAISDFALIFGRTAFGLSFYLIGALFKIYETKLKRWIIRPESFFALYVFYVSLESFFNGFTYFLMIGKFSNGPFITYLGTFSAIGMIYIISSYLALNIAENNLFLKIGRHTFAIMTWHITIFLLINIILYFFNLITKTDLSTIFFVYKKEQFWFIYVIAGLLTPLLITAGYSYLTKKIKSCFI